MIACGQRLDPGLSCAYSVSAIAGKCRLLSHCLDDPDFVRPERPTADVIDRERTDHPVLDE
jgi:hypothetical protein